MDEAKQPQQSELSKMIEKMTGKKLPVRTLAECGFIENEDGSLTYVREKDTTRPQKRKDNA